MNTVPPDTSQLAASLLDAVVESVPVGVLVLDGDLQVIRANAALCELVGTEEAAQLGRPLQAVLPWIPEAAVRHAFETGVIAEDIALGTDDDAGLAHRFTVSLRPSPPSRASRPWRASFAMWPTWSRGGAAWAGSSNSAAPSRGRHAGRGDRDHPRARPGADGRDTVAAVLRAESGDDLEMVGTAGLDERIDRDWSRFDLEPRTPTGAAVTSGEPDVP